LSNLFKKCFSSGFYHVDVWASAFVVPLVAAAFVGVAAVGGVNVVDGVGNNNPVEPVLIVLNATGYVWVRFGSEPEAISLNSLIKNYEK
jgi:hypothetical protein